MKFHQKKFATPTVAAALLVIGCNLLPLSALAAPNGSSAVDAEVALNQKLHLPSKPGIRSLYEHTHATEVRMGHHASFEHSRCIKLGNPRSCRTVT